MCDFDAANGDGESVVVQQFPTFERLTSVHVNATDQFALTSGSGVQNTVFM